MHPNVLYFNRKHSCGLNWQYQWHWQCSNNAQHQLHKRREKFKKKMKKNIKMGMNNTDERKWSSNPLNCIQRTKSNRIGIQTTTTKLYEIRGNAVWPTWHIPLHAQTHKLVHSHVIRQQNERNNNVFDKQNKRNEAKGKRSAMESERDCKSVRVRRQHIGEVCEHETKNIIDKWRRGHKGLPITHGAISKQQQQRQT